MVSIIIPMYNAEKYIEKCLDSILAQTYRDLEVIIIDDGSKDGSAEKVGKYVESDSRFSLIRQDNHGLVYSRKRGIEKSQGEYVLFVDSDDWISANAVEEMMEMVTESGGADVVACGALKAYLFENVDIEFGDNKEKKASDCNSDSAIEGAEDDNSYWCYQKECNIAEEGIYVEQKLEELKHRLFCIEDYFVLALLPYLWNKLWKRKLIERFVLDADERLKVGEDVAIGFPAILSAKSLVVTNRAFYCYRQNGESMMRGSVDEVAEYENATNLVLYLKNETKKIRYYDAASQGIERFLHNQLYTRAYGLLNKQNNCAGLFSFIDEMPTDLVIYGAGELGKAVYRYASTRTIVKAWIDGRADIYYKLGIPVISLKDYTPDENDTVVVAVFRAKSVSAITKTLIDVGVNPEHIRRIGIIR